MRVCQRQRRHLWESLREWLLVPPFTRAFLKSPSSRGLSAIAELLVTFRLLMSNLTERPTPKLYPMLGPMLNLVYSLRYLTMIPPIKISKNFDAILKPAPLCVAVVSNCSNLSNNEDKDGQLMFAPNLVQFGSTQLWEQVVSFVWEKM